MNLRDDSNRYRGQCDRHMQPRQESSLVSKVDFGLNFDRHLNMKINLFSKEALL